MATNRYMEAIKSPLKVVNDLFEKFIQKPGSQPSAFDPSKYFADLFASIEARDQIPSINNVPVQQLPKNTLVRFRCMVQDSGLGQEMFMAAYKKKDPKTGNEKIVCYRYTEDTVDIDDETMEPDTITSDWFGERCITYCVSPPGETTWLKDCLYRSSDYEQEFSRLSLAEREREEKCAAAKEKFPLSDVPHASAIVKFYEAVESVRVGQLIEVIGVLTHVQQQQQQPNDTGIDFDTPLTTLSGTPVIHAITHRSLDGAEAGAFMLRKEKQHDLLHQARDIRPKLVEHIATTFGGDLLVAEFVLLHLLSRVSSATRGVKVGHFALNISNFPEHSNKKTEGSSAVSLVRSLLEDLVQHLVMVPLTIDVLNKKSFSPKSVNESLQAGLLQLVEGTLLIIDETVLTEGSLGDTGVRNIHALNNIVQNQTLSYVFPYSQFEFDTDLAVLSLSPGKSMLPNHCSVRMQPKYSTDEKPHVPKETLDIFRKYIHAAKHAVCDIPDKVSEHIQQSFVEERKAASQNSEQLTSQEDLMFRVNLARLVSLSFGETTLTTESYEHAKRLDIARRERLAKSSKPNRN